MANVVSSTRVKVVIEIEGVEVTFVRGRHGPEPIARKGRQGKRDYELAIHLEPAAMANAKWLAASEFRKHNEGENPSMWKEPAPVAECVALEALGELAGGSAKEAQPQAEQLELFPTPKEHFGVYSRED